MRGRSKPLAAPQRTTIECAGTVFVGWAGTVGVVGAEVPPPLPAGASPPDVV